jgi:hypothetical protein
MSLYIPNQRFASVHDAKIDRYLGKETADLVRRTYLGTYSPIRLGAVPGRVYVQDGNFFGTLEGDGQFGLLDRMRLGLQRYLRKPHANAGFTGLSDLVSEMAAGKKQQLFYSKTGVTGVANVGNTLWYEGVSPAAGAVAAAIPAGEEISNTTLGALGQQNAAGGDTLHYLGVEGAMATVANMVLMMYDRMWQGRPNANTNVSQTITGTFGTYATTADCFGNYCFVEVNVALAATAHTVTVGYTNQVASATTAAIVGVSGAIAKRFDHAGWFIPLAGTDTGFTKFGSIQFSAALTAGTAVLVAAHPIVSLPFGIANFPITLDGISAGWSLERIYDGACLAFMEFKTATTATSYFGKVNLVSG